MKFLNHTLSNGLEVVGEYRENAQSVAIGFFVKTGARDETPEVSGVSHFLEHMMFKGTAKRSALDITYCLGAIGAQANAFTSEENTVYYMAVLPENLPEALELLCDMLRPALDSEEFDTEKNVILEEIALYQDRPTHVLFENTMRLHFGEHPAGNSVLGSKESVSGISCRQMRKYFESRYVPSNMVFTIAGSFGWEKVCKDLEAYCGAWENKKVTRQQPAFLPHDTVKEYTREDLQAAHICLTAEGISAQNEEMVYPLHILSSIMGSGSGSRTYWELVDKGLAEAAYVGSDEMDGIGMLYAYACTAPERVKEVTSILEGIMKTPGEFTDEQLSRAKTKVMTSLVLQGESVMRRMMSIGQHWIYNQNYIPLSEEVKRYQSVNRKGVERLLERLSFKPLCRTTLLPVS